jgi:hypothetical protein
MTLGFCVAGLIQHSSRFYLRRGEDGMNEEEVGLIDWSFGERGSGKCYGKCDGECETRMRGRVSSFGVAKK